MIFCLLYSAEFPVEKKSFEYFNSSLIFRAGRLSFTVLFPNTLCSYLSLLSLPSPPGALPLSVPSFLCCSYPIILSLPHLVPKPYLSPLTVPLWILHLHACIHMYIHIPQTYMHICTYTYTHMYIHIHLSLRSTYENTVFVSLNLAYSV